MIYFVSMIDSFMSGWGKARNRINMLVFRCSSLAQARIVADNAMARTDMKEVEIWKHNIPWHDPRDYYVQWKNRQTYPSWYKKGYFMRLK